MLLLGGGCLVSDGDPFLPFRSVRYRVTKIITEQPSIVSVARGVSSTAAVMFQLLFGARIEADSTAPVFLQHSATIHKCTPALGSQAVKPVPSRTVKNEHSQSLSSVLCRHASCHRVKKDRGHRSVEFASIRDV